MTTGSQVVLVNPTGATTEFGRDTREQTNQELLDAEDMLTASDVAETIVTAVDQDPPGVSTELDLFRRDIYERF
jgi:NADP-dependent 3-hydroxy acid dehydrogenase YdfG